MVDCKICLLVSNDPDDQQILFEAIKEVSKSIVMVAVLEGVQVVSVLQSKKLRPDFIVVDIDMDGAGGKFLDELARYSEPYEVPLIVFSEDDYQFEKPYPYFSISKQLQYSEIRSKLSLILFSAPGKSR